MNEIYRKTGEAKNVQFEAKNIRYDVKNVCF
jgi:hypothetical protein